MSNEVSLTWTAEVVQDPDNPEEYLLAFPDEAIEKLGWKEGDTLSWDVRDDGTVVVTKKE